MPNLPGSSSGGGLIGGGGSGGGGGGGIVVISFFVLAAGSVKFAPELFTGCARTKSSKEIPFKYFPQDQIKPIPKPYTQEPNPFVREKNDIDEKVGDEIKDKGLDLLEKILEPKDSTDK